MKKTIAGLSCIIAAFLLVTGAVFAAGGTVSVFAGKGDPLMKDGKRMEAAFNQPYGITADKNGDLLVADSYNNRICRITGDSVITIAGYSDKTDAYGFPKGGYFDGEVAVSRFNKPRYVAVDSKGNIFVSDTGNNVIRKIADGKVYTFSGTGKAGYKDGKADTAMYSGPSGIAVDKSDNLYVADSLNHVIRKITPDGTVTTYAGKNSADGGYKEGASRAALFNEPSDVALDSRGAVYVLDSGNQMIRKISGGQTAAVAGFKAGSIPGTGYAEGGIKNGRAAEARFNFPKGMTIADDGTVFVADTWNHRIRAVKPDGSVITVAGTGVPGKTDGEINGAAFNAPAGVVYKSGILYIADMWNNCIRALPINTSSMISVSTREELLEGVEFTPDTADFEVWVDKNPLSFPDVLPFVKDGKVYLPLRFICEPWGAKVEWLQETRQVKVSGEGWSKLFTPGKDATSFKDGRTMIESSALAASVGIRVEWYPEHNAVVISTR